MARTPFQKVSDFISGRFSLENIPGFPYDQFIRQRGIYDECDNWFRGYALDDQPSTQGTQLDLYPLRINPLQSTVLKHAYTLFGETEDDGRPLVYPTLIPADKGQKKIAQEAAEAINYVWWENSGRALMMENGILSQIYGGCVFKLTYVPWEAKKEARGGWRNIPIRIEKIHVRSFIGRPDAGDMFRLKEAWIVSDISLEEARKWGYNGDDNEPIMTEYYSNTEHRIYINHVPATFTIPIPDGIENPLNGVNTFGFVPVVYIPHYRAGTFYGTNAIDQLKGLVKEMNLRFGDYGDAVNDDSHIPLAMRNVNGSPQVKRIGNGITVLDLGGTANVSGNEQEPDVFEMRKQKASVAMGGLLDEIIKQYRRDSFTPAVADGEDEGSQRSALTLATRFWPLTSHVGLERIFFGAGLDVLQTYLLRMMAIKNLGGITEAHTTMRMKQNWAPMLPRDREADVSEWTNRAAQNLGSIEHLLELTRDVEDVTEERQKILDWLKDKAEIEAKAQAQFAPKPSFGGTPGPEKKPDKTPTQQRGGGGGK